MTQQNDRLGKPNRGEVWRIVGRNYDRAVYLDTVPDNPSDGSNWIGIREKFGSRYLDNLEMMVRPIEKIGEIPGSIDLTEDSDVLFQLLEGYGG